MTPTPATHGGLTVAKERPIIFSAAMILALLNNSKTMTRRIVKPQPSVTTPTMASWYDSKCDLWRDLKQYARDCCPYGSVGDKLWVREGFCEAANDDGTLAWNADGETYKVYYRCDDREHDVIRLDDYGAFKWNKDGTAASPWKSPLFMPRWASRTTLEITGVHVEKLQDISEADAKAEGATPLDPGTQVSEFSSRITGSPYRHGFHAVWSTIHAADGPHGWAANPFVWVLEFKRVSL